MASPASPTPLQPRPAVEPNVVRYEDLKTWIAAQESFEAVTSLPAPLTKAQRKALAAFKLPPLEEPAIGDTDWVSLLMRYRDAHKDNQGIIFADTPCPSPLNPSAPPHWTCCVTISEAPGHAFPPGPKATEEAQVSPPSFARKKDAKQYAAKSAVAWLMEQGRMPANAVDAVFPKPKPTPSPAPVKLQPGPSVSPSGASPQSQSDDSVAARIPQLCQQLNMPLPRYVVIPHDVIPGLCSGYADFGGDMRIPSRVGRVEDVYGRKAAKERMAEQVLEYLLEVEANRREMVEAVMTELDQQE